MKYLTVIAVLLITACATTGELVPDLKTSPKFDDTPICNKPLTGNACIDEVEKKYCERMKELAPDVQEIVQHDVLCAHYEGNQPKLDELNCYKDDSKVMAAMKIYWDKPEGQALVYFPEKYETAKAECSRK